MCDQVVCEQVVCAKVVCEEVVCEEVVCDQVVCEQVVCGQVVCGQVVCEQVVCGQVVCEEVVCGQVVCGSCAEEAGGGKRRRQEGVHKQKQEPHTKMQGTKTHISSTKFQHESAASGPSSGHPMYEHLPSSRQSHSQNDPKTLPGPRPNESTASTLAPEVISCSTTAQWPLRAA